MLTFGEVSYQVWPQPPFTNRLRARIRAVRDHRMMMDVVDFYVSRSRKNITNQLCSQLELARIDAERHLIALLEKLESWVEQRRDEENTESDERPSAPELSSEERESALEFLRDKNLVQNILGDMQDMGYVGEDNAKLLGYLISISRKLEKPLSGIVLSQSGAGKSSLTDLVESLTPPEDVVLFSRLSPQALYWMERDALKRRLLILEERAGALEADYSIRVLQSRQKLVQATVIKDPVTGKLTTKTFVVEGPVAYLETTTNNRINYENATRCFEISLDESQEQTRRVQAWQRSGRLASRRDRRQIQEAIKNRHHNAQRILEPVLVYIPYAEHLSFPSKWLRTRRDNERFLCLIEAIAFLHQFQRERGTTDEGTPYILANLDDYRLAYQLAKDVLAITLHELSREAKDLWDTLREWVLENDEQRPNEVIFSRRDLRSVTGLEDHRLRASLQELVEMEYLETLTGSVGKAYQYRLASANDPQNPIMRELTTPEELERLWKGDKS
jgi:DNA primase